MPVTAKIYDNYNISFNDLENNWIYGNNTEKTMIGTRDVPIISHSNYVQLPYITNNPTVYSYGLAEFYLNNTNSVFKREDVTINPSQFPYPEATNFDFDCQGYGINYTASEVEFIHYEIKLGDGLSEQYSIVALIDNPYSTTSNSGTFSSEVLNYLNDGQNHNVRIDAYLITTQNTGRLITKVSRMKRLNCQTRKSENIKPSKEATAEEIDELNTIIEKLAKK